MNVTAGFDINVTITDVASHGNASVQGLPDGYETLILIYNMLRFIEAALGIGGNGLTIVAIAKYDELQTGANYFVLSLALADFSTGITAPIAFVVSQLKRLPIYSQLCLFKELLYQLGNTGNVFSVTAIGLDRYVAVFYPLRYGSMMTLGRAKVLVLLIWIVNLGYKLAMIYGGNQIRPESLCSVSSFLVPQAKMASLIIFGIFSITNVIIYIRVSLLAWKQSRQIRAEQASFGMSDSSKGQAKITKTMLLVVGLYFLFTIPALVVTSIIQGPGYPLWVYYMYHLTILIWFANSFVNPFIYGWRYQTFRKNYKRLLGMKA